MSPKKVLIYTDGSSRGNPGPSGIGIVVFPIDDQTTPLKEISQYIGVATNNVAEYEAVIHALKWLIMENTEGAIIRLDSELVYKQLAGEYRVKSPRVAPLIKRINDLKTRIKTVHLELIPRNENRLANRLAQKASGRSAIKRRSFKQDELIKP